MMEQLDLYLSIAIKAAKMSGDILKRNFKKQFIIEDKGNRDIVTSIDKASEELLYRYFQKVTPEINFYGEETLGNIEGISWVVDPLDGTKNYVHRIPYFGVSIALCEDLLPIVGVVYFPLLGELYMAIKGNGAFLVKNNEKSIFVKKQRILCSSTERIDHCFLATGFPHSKSQLLGDYMNELENVLKNVSAVRRFGSAAYDLCQVAKGTFDGFWEHGLESWDMAAGALIAEEAGCIVSKSDGAPWNIKSPTIFVSNPKLHTKLLDIFSSK
jgi:myo-inositol-1(or 4)-monophosphatase